MGGNRIFRRSGWARRCRDRTFLLDERREHQRQQFQDEVLTLPELFAHGRPRLREGHHNHGFQTRDRARSPPLGASDSKITAVP